MRRYFCDSGAWVVSMARFDSYLMLCTSFGNSKRDGSVVADKYTVGSYFFSPSSVIPVDVTQHTSHLLAVSRVSRKRLNSVD